MKKIFYFAAAAAISILASCQKEEISGQEEVVESTPIEFTASIDFTKVSVDSAGKVSWEQGDEIVISNGKVSKVYIALNGGESATFTCETKDLPAFSKPGTYRATYGKAPDPRMEQEYSSTPGKWIYMEAECNSSESFVPHFNFSVKCGLLKLHLYCNPCRPVSKIFVSDGTDTYTLRCSGKGSAGERIHEGKDFYIALPAGTYTKYVIRDATGYEAVKTVKSGKTGTAIGTNEISMVSFTNLSFGAPEYPESGTDAILINGIWWAPVNCGYSKSNALGLLYQWGRKYGQSADKKVKPEFVNKPARSMSAGSQIGNKDKFYRLSWCWFLPCHITDKWQPRYNPCPEGWRVPTKMEFDRLTNRMIGKDYMWVTGKDITGTGTGAYNGYLFKYKNEGGESSSLFFPAVGYRSYLDGAVCNQNSIGGYLLSEPSAINAFNAKNLSFTANFAPKIKEDARAVGRSVRCVRE